MAESNPNPIYDAQLLKSLDFEPSHRCEYAECISTAPVLLFMTCCGHSFVVCHFHADVLQQRVMSMGRPQCRKCKAAPVSVKAVPFPAGVA